MDNFKRLLIDTIQCANIKGVTDEVLVFNFGKYLLLAYAAGNYISIILGVLDEKNTKITLRLLGHHDSCWVSGVETFVDTLLEKYAQNPKKSLHLRSIASVKVKELDADTFDKIRNIDRRTKDVIPYTFKLSPLLTEGLERIK